MKDPNKRCVECGKELVLERNSCAPSPDFSHGHPYAIFKCEDGHLSGSMRCELNLPSCQHQQENLGRAFGGAINGTSDIPEAISELCNTKDCKCHPKPQEERSVEMTEEIATDAARFSSFAQRVKMAYWTEFEKDRTSEPSGNLCREKELDRILMHAWKEVAEARADERKKVEDDLKQLLYSHESDLTVCEYHETYKKGCGWCSSRNDDIFVTIGIRQALKRVSRTL